MSYTPPAPEPRRMLGVTDADLLTMLPAQLYEKLTLHAAPRRRQPILITSDPALVRQVLGDDGTTFARSPEVVSAFTPLMGPGLFLSSGGEWRRQRAMLDPALGQLRVRAMQSHLRAALEGFLAGAAGELDLYAAMNALVLDIICRTIFSTPLLAAEQAELHALFDAFQRAAPETNPIALLARPRGAPPPAHDAFDAASQAIRDFLARHVDRRLGGAAPDHEGTDLLAAVLAARDASGAGFSQREVIDQLALLFFAGHDTTAGALTWALFILAERPELATAMRAEAQAVAPGREVTVDDLPRLPLTRQIGLETLRLYPSAGFISRTVARPLTLGGHDLAEGTLVITSPWIIHRHPLVWERPNEFDPARFSREREREIPPGAFLPFGFGPRSCPGRSLALAEIPFLLAGILRRFRLKAANPAAAMPISRLTLRPREPILCRFVALDA
jgi:cytochrome P450